MNDLQTMLSMQKSLQEYLGADFTAMSPEDATAFIKEHSIHLNQEVNEMLYELPFFKPWKDYSTMTNEEVKEAFGKARMECVDAWHFFMNIMLGLGLTAEDFTEMYMAKNKENYRRQQEGYTADVSYKDQSPDEVMSSTNTPICRVAMDDEVNYSSDFIAILNKPDGNASVLYNTDVLSMGIALKMIALEYTKLAEQCSDEELADVERILNGEVEITNA